MNQDQILGYVRTLCTMAATILGYSAAQTDKLTSGMLGLTSFALLCISLYGTWKANTVKSKTASVADTLPANGVIKTTPELAAAIPNPKVQAAA